MSVPGLHFGVSHVRSIVLSSQRMSFRMLTWQPSNIGQKTWITTVAWAYELAVLVLVVDEGQMRSGGVRLKVLMQKVAVGRAAPGFEQAVGIRCKQQWHEYKMSREQLVGITGQKVQADGGRVVLVEGHEVWEEWTEQAVVEDTEWSREAKGQWRAKEQAAVNHRWSRDLESEVVERDKVYDRG